MLFGGTFIGGGVVAVGRGPHSRNPNATSRNRCLFGDVIVTRDECSRH